MTGLSLSLYYSPVICGTSLSITLRTTPLAVDMCECRAKLRVLACAAREAVFRRGTSKFSRSLCPCGGVYRSMLVDLADECHYVVDVRVVRVGGSVIYFIHIHP